ncbi:MAG TPA: SpoIID/LytB domain-containing protein [Holophagaceae bacterium]|nr:SpoIID/LytB domain-containing protein [Holophagaceae bacterium]
MMPRRLLPLLAASLTLSAQGPQVRVGILVGVTEVQVSMDGGGQIQDLKGRALRTLKPGEKLRLWWDTKGAAPRNSEYRVQVGAPMAMGAAEALMGRLKALDSEAPARVRVSDGDTWRVLLGHFKSSDEATPLVEKLENAGFDELWVSSESLAAPRAKGRALYAITEAYDRIPLPEGVRFAARGPFTDIAGKGRYRGRIEVVPNRQGTLSVINTVDLESYLKGVVPREMGAWNYPALEALKAQAVAARTYAVANLGKRKEEGYDLVDTVSDQVYGGADGEQNLTDLAVQQTAGLVATYGGKPIQALFMADCGGSTVDVSWVFGGEAPYLKAATCYPDQPKTRLFISGAPVTAEAAQPWLTWNILKLAAAGAVPPSWLKGEVLSKPGRAEDAIPAVAALQKRLGLTVTPLAGGNLALAMARALGYGNLPQGQERPQDAAYFGATALPAQDRLLASFLVRQGLIRAQDLRAAPTLGDALETLGRLWQGLEPMEPKAGTLLMDGQVRPKKEGPQAFPLAAQVLIAEQAPDGSLRLVPRSQIQVGDQVMWLDGAQAGSQASGGAPAAVVIRRLDPDGAAWDRYNPTAHWRVAIGERDLVAMIRRRAPIADITELRAKANENGRVLDLDVRDTAGRSHHFSGMRIRNLLGLKDNVFSFTVLGKAPDRTWVFFGRGWGHGVGMCQTGAYGMALEGATCDQILKHYYSGIELTKIPE